MARAGCTREEKRRWRKTQLLVAIGRKKPKTSVLLLMVDLRFRVSDWICKERGLPCPLPSSYIRA